MSFILCGQCEQQNAVTADRCSNCDAKLIPISRDRADPFFPGTYLHHGRYRIQELIASGKLGRIYQGEDTSEGRAIALREFIPIAKPATSEKIVQLLTSAIVQQPQFEHPQVAQFWQVFAEDDRIFLVGYLLQGQSYKFLLKQRMRSGRPFSSAEIIQLWRHVLPILSHLHDRGVIHRYIAPDNLLKLGGDRPIILSDCGGIQELAIKLMSPNNFTANVAGTWANIPKGKLGYAPKEQLQQGIFNPSSDLYALAVTSLVLMTGKPPTKLIDVFTMSWSWHRELDLTPVVKQYLSKMLADKPGDRFSSAAELQQLIESNPDLPSPITEPSDRTVDPPELTDENVATDVTTTVATTGLPQQEDEAFDISTEASQKLSSEIPQPDSSSIIIPPEILGWNWGAALLPGIWCLSNHVWAGLFAWVGFLVDFGAGLSIWLIMGLIMGANGNEWAWKSRNWRNVAEFKKHQRGWGVLVGSIAVTLLCLFVLIIFFIFGV